jgi:HEAT repeat protein
MELKTVFSDKTTNSKGKTVTLAKSVLENKITINEIIDFASTQKDPIKATCIETIEVVTQSNPELASEKTLDFVISSLSDKAPRIKWESARVIANTIQLFPKKQSTAISSLLRNTTHEGTVVRWSAAMALAAILKTGSAESKTIITKIKDLAEKEEKNSIKRIYGSVLK